jgi:predicted ATP-grasp superfamily ATP-dependent carboligase
MTDELRLSSEPTLRRPLMVVAFRGWNDGGQGASLAGGYLAKTWSAARFGEIDPEGFYDFQATRPHVTLVEGLTRRIDWPDNAFYHAAIPGLGRDVVLMLGVEPNLRWRTFSDLILEVATRLNVEMLVTLGSLLADVPHTRPAPVTAAASDKAMIARYGLEPSRYEGPTGIVGIVHDACRRDNIPSVSLWAAVPHYVSLAPSPRAALALCTRLGELIGASIDVAELEEAVDAYNEQVSEAVAADAETQAYVEELEQRTDALEDNLPSGDSLAAELTRFLREREQEDGGTGGPGPSEPD